jgi:hypothetical protein
MSATGLRISDPSLVSYRHLVGCCRSAGNMAFRCLTPSTGVVCRCGQRLWSASRLTAPEAVGHQDAYPRPACRGQCSAVTW